MSGWAQCGSDECHYRSFHGKNGHVVRRPTDWAALFDGVFLGAWEEQDHAMAAVEAAAAEWGGM